MNFSDRTYPDIVRDLLTVLTGGTIAETHTIGATVPDLIHLDNRPVRRISHLQGQIQLGEELVDYRFSERDFELIGTEENPDERVAIRFRDRAQKPAPQTTLTVNYYPDRLKPTPITDVNVGSVSRTLIETLSRVMTSWGGTSSVTRRRLIFCILSIMGIRMIKPGPLLPIRRPNLKITPLSYSLSILMALAKNRMTSARTIKRDMFIVKPPI